MKFLFTSLFATFLALSVSAQTKLSGTTIGSSPVNYGNGTQYAKYAFDGNLNTFYASNQRFYTWVGLDLGTPHVIQKVAFAPRNNHEYRLRLGVIEGANSADFIDAVPLYIIKETPQEGVMTEAAIACTKGFRYVRYVGPNDCRCNIAELAFYGKAGMGTDDQYYQPGNLPVVSIHTSGAQDVTSKSQYLEGHVQIISEKGTTLFSSNTKVKGRGNFSWTLPKKPYKLKLEESASLLDFPAKAKKWTLINNYGDKTLMRNLLAFHVSRCFEMAYTPAGRAVDVFLNGEYKGCYQLCDQIDVRPHRVDVKEMKKKDISGSALTGGYLIEVDAYAYKETSKFTSQYKRVPVTIKSPDEDDIKSEQTNYIRKFFNQFETKLFASNYKSLTSGYRSIFDAESFLKHFLISEFTGNTDAYWSVYMYKNRDENKLYTGPVWDFDLAFENDKRTYPINNLWDYVCLSKGSAANGFRDFVRRILSDSQSLEDLKTYWTKVRYHKGLSVNEMNAVVDEYAKKIGPSQELNFLRWPIMNQYVHENPRVYGSYQGEVDNVKNYIAQRIQWLDDKVGLDPDGVDEVAMAGLIASEGSSLIVDGFVNATVVVYNMTGRMVAQFTADGYITRELPRGIYIVRVTQEMGGVQTQKIAIQ
jgi:hypothetical protein